MMIFCALTLEPAARDFSFQALLSLTFVSFTVWASHLEDIYLFLQSGFFLFCLIKWYYKKQFFSLFLSLPLFFCEHRAVDNQLYVATVSPARDEKASYVAWGHSTVVNPW